MKKVCLVFGLFALLITGSPASSEDSVMVIGQGASSCGAWTKSRDDYVTHHYQLQWVLGFISAMNWQNTEKQARFADTDAVAAFIDNYCAANPLKGMVGAAASVVQEGGGPEWKHD
jgi:hypothetical protein